MSSKNISLREEAYEALAARKGEGESFSDVVLRLAGQRTKADVRELAGFMDADDFDQRMAASEREVRDEFEKIRKSDE